MLPNYAIERVGVAAVELAFSRWGWMFREQPTLDCGVDALVERSWSHLASGELIALQIKSGKSWFKEPTDHGWIFRGKMDHLRYWLRHCLPVVLLLHDPESGNTYWVHITKQAIERTRSGWKIVVPSEHLLGPDAYREFDVIAGESGKPIEDRLEFILDTTNLCPLLGAPLQFEQSFCKDGCQVIDTRSSSRTARIPLPLTSERLVPFWEI